MPWGWIFAQIIGDERSTKVAKIIVVHWRLTFLWWSQVCFPMNLYGHHTFVWEKCWEFQTTSPLKPLGQCCLNFMWRLLRLEERKIAKMVAVHWPRWPPCPYMVYIYIYIYILGWIFAQTLTFDLFTVRSSLLPYAFVWAQYICMGKMLRISNNFSSEASGPVLLKSYMEPP